MKFYIVPGLAITIIAILCGLLSQRPEVLRSGATLSTGKYLQQSSAPADPEDQQAWDEFASLVHPTTAHPAADPNRPEWVTWNNKCDAGLTGACDSIPSQRGPTTAADQSSADIPGQILAEFEKESGAKKRQFVKAFSQEPQLASVLFNQQATAGVAKIGNVATLTTVVQNLDAAKATGTFRHLPQGSFSIGSEITKLIWEIIPADQTQSLRLYDPQNPHQLRGFEQLNGISSWGSYFVTNNGQICPAQLPAYGSIHRKITVPLDCFYWFPLHTSDSCSQFSSSVRTAWCQPGLRERDFLIILVGFHVMKLTAANPNWIWMTYYWTRDTSGRLGWLAPWNHFSMLTTTVIQKNAADGHKFVFNPYLEGLQDNGLHSNCLSCHSFAAYSPLSSKLQDGIRIGSIYPYPSRQRHKDEHAYFADSVQTAFVWSISTSIPPPPTHGTEGLVQFPALLRRALKLQFSTK